MSATLAVTVLLSSRVAWSLEACSEGTNRGDNTCFAYLVGGVAMGLAIMWLSKRLMPRIHRQLEASSDVSDDAKRRNASTIRIYETVWLLMSLAGPAMGLYYMAMCYMTCHPVS